MSNKVEIQQKETELKKLQQDYARKMKGIAKLKGDLFFVTVREANSLTQKIYALKKKISYLENNEPMNGWADSITKINILE